MLQEISQTVKRLPQWRLIHQQLRRCAGLKLELDLEEAGWLRKMMAHALWRRFGCATAMEYMERELGYAPREARDRLRMARLLGDQPKLERALRDGRLKASAVRELGRVVTSDTVDAWIERAQGKPLRDVEQMVSGRVKGDRPDDPSKPEAVVRPLRFDDIDGATMALVRQLRVVIGEATGEHLDDNAFVSALCQWALRGQKSDDRGPAYQIAVTICEHCKRAEQLGGGRAIPLTEAEVERATCDANWIGATDAPSPARAKADVPPATRRLVFHRDQERCTVPGCRSALGLELHHIIAREHDGPHDPWNLTVLCSAHHAFLHEGLLTITGRAPDGLEFLRSDPAVPPPDVAAQARATLVHLGFKSAEAKAAVDEAMTHVGHDVDVEDLVRVALKYAPKPRGPSS